MFKKCVRIGSCSNCKAFKSRGTTVYGAEKEDLEHFLLRCPAYTDMRAAISNLTCNVLENTQNIIGHFLFDQHYSDKKLNTLYSFWKIRQKNTYR